MEKRLSNVFLICSIILFMISCSIEKINQSNYLSKGDDLNSATKVRAEYNHVYEQDLTFITTVGTKTTSGLSNFKDITSTDTDIYVLTGSGIRKINCSLIKPYTAIPYNLSQYIAYGSWDGIDYTNYNWGITAYSNANKKIYLHCEHGVPDMAIDYPQIDFVAVGPYGNYTYWTNSYDIYELEGLSVSSSEALILFLKVSSYPVSTRIIQFEFKYSTMQLLQKATTYVPMYSKSSFVNYLGYFFISSISYIYSYFFTQYAGSNTTYSEQFASPYTEHGHYFQGDVRCVTQTKMDLGYYNSEQGLWLLDVIPYKLNDTAYYASNLYWLPLKQLYF